MSDRRAELKEGWTRGLKYGASPDFGKGFDRGLIFGFALAGFLAVAAGGAIVCMGHTTVGSVLASFGALMEVVTLGLFVRLMSVEE